MLYTFILPIVLAITLLTHFSNRTCMFVSMSVYKFVLSRFSLRNMDKALGAAEKKKKEKEKKRKEKKKKEKKKRKNSIHCHKVSYTLYIVSKSVLYTRSPCFSRLISPAIVNTSH